MSLPIRGAAGAAMPGALDEGPPEADGALPQLRGDLSAPAPRPLELTLRVHNRAGIPIIEGRSSVAAGQVAITFRDLRPIGIEGYAHVSPGRRAEVAQRVWSRRAYATLAPSAER